MVTVVTLMRGPTCSEHLLCAKVGVFHMYGSPAEWSPGLTQEALQKDPEVLLAYVNPALSKAPSAWEVAPQCPDGLSLSRGKTQVWLQPELSLEGGGPLLRGAECSPVPGVPQEPLLCP